MRRKIFIFLILYTICGMASVYYLGGQKNSQFYHAKKYQVFEYHRPYNKQISKRFNIVPAHSLAVENGFYRITSNVIFNQNVTFKYPKTAIDKGNIRETGAILYIGSDTNKAMNTANHIAVVMSGYLFTHNASEDDQKDIDKVIKAIDKHLKEHKIQQKVIPILTDSPYDLHAYLPAKKRIIQGPQLMPLAPDHGLMRSDALSNISQTMRQNTIHDIFTWPLSAGPEVMYHILCLIDGCR